MNFLTDFGSPAILLPLSLIIGGWLAVYSGRRMAFAWFAAMAACIGLTALLKVYFAGCHLHLAGIHSPSGHVSASAYVYGGLVLILAARHSRPWPGLWALAGTTWVLGIGATRVYNGSHTLAEVIAGLMLGGAGLALFAALYLPQARAYKLSLPLLAVTMLVAIALHGRQLQLEPLLREFGAYLASRAPICPSYEIQTPR